MSLNLWTGGVNGLFLWATEIKKAYLWTIEVFSSAPSNWLLNNLVSYYEFENNVLDSHWAFDWTDFWTSDVAWKILRGRNFDWVNDYINFWTQNYADTFSTSFWFKTTDWTTDNYMLSKYNTWTSSRDWAVIMWDFTWWAWTIWFYVLSNGVGAIDRAYTTNTFNDWVWHLVECVQYWDWVTRVDIYVDWVLQTVTRVGSAQSTVHNSTARVLVWNRDWASVFYSWEIDEISIYEQANTQQNATDRYNSWAWLPYGDYTN